MGNDRVFDMSRDGFKLRFVNFSIGLSFLIFSIACTDLLDTRTKQIESYQSLAERFIKTGNYPEAAKELEKIIKLDFKNDSAHYRLGEVFTKLGHRAKAFEAYSNAANVNPHNLKAQLKLAQILLFLKKIKAARLRTEKILAKAPDNLDALRILSHIQLHEGNDYAAVSTMERALSLYPENSDILLGLSRLHLGRNELGKADRAYLQAALTDPLLRRFIVQLADTGYRSIPVIARDYERRGKFHAAERIYRTVADSIDGEGKVVFLTELAAFYVRRQSYAKALDVLHAAFSINDGLDTLLLIGHLHLDFKKIESAEKIADELLRDYPGQMDANYLKGRIHYYKKDYRNAFEHFESVLKEAPKFAKAHYYRGLCLLSRGEVERAKTSLETAVEINPRLNEARVKLAWMYLYYFEKGNLSLARKHLEPVLVQNPDHKEGLILFGHLKTREEDAEAAEAAYKRLIAVDPKQPIGYFKLGLLNYRFGRQPEALRSFEKTVEADPLHKGALTFIINIHLRNRDSEKALEACRTNRKQTAGNPHHAGFIENLKGRIHLVTGDFKTAKDHFERSIELDPDFLSSHLALTKLYLRTNRVKEVIDHFETQVRKDPEFLLGFMVLGIIFDEQGERDKAESYYRRALAVNPDFVPAANNLAWSLAERNKNLNEAMILSRNTKYLMPKNPHISDTLGWISYKLGYYGKAISNLEESVSMQPDNALYHYHLGKAYYENAQLEEARVYLKKALALNPDLDWAQDARRILQGYRSLDG